jgi:Ca2+-binding EF-hand superfamily protein
MTMADEISIDELRRSAKRAGLALPDDELRCILPGVNRAKKQATELRDIVTADDEPASTYGAAKTSRK